MVRKSVKSKSLRSRVKRTNKNNKSKSSTRKNRISRKNVKFNLRKNRTKHFSNKYKILLKSKSKSKKQRRQSSKSKLQLKRKNVHQKGGAIPFSELGEVYEGIQHLGKEVMNPFFDTATPAQGNPENPNVNPNVSTQFVVTDGTDAKFIAPDLKSHFVSAFPSSTT